MRKAVIFFIKMLVFVLLTKDHITIDDCEIKEVNYKLVDKMKTHTQVELYDTEINNKKILCSKNINNLNIECVYVSCEIIEKSILSLNWIIKEYSANLTIDDNMFEFRKGAKVFDECINFLKEQKTLKKFESSPSMFEAKTLFKDKNVSDLNFVLVYNLLLNIEKSPPKSLINECANCDFSFNNFSYCSL